VTKRVQTTVVATDNVTLRTMSALNRNQFLAVCTKYSHGVDPVTRCKIENIIRDNFARTRNVSPRFYTGTVHQYEYFYSAIKHDVALRPGSNAKTSTL